MLSIDIHYLFQCALKALAEGAFQIGEFNDLHGRIGIALDVIFVSDRLRVAGRRALLSLLGLLLFLMQLIDSCGNNRGALEDVIVDDRFDLLARGDHGSVSLRSSSRRLESNETA